MHWTDPATSQDSLAELEKTLWGAANKHRGSVTELADYLSSRTEGLRGFSASNLWRMRQFYERWQDAPEKLATLLRELSWSARLDLLIRSKTHEFLDLEAE